MKTSWMAAGLAVALLAIVSRGLAEPRASGGAVRAGVVEQVVTDGFGRTAASAEAMALEHGRDRVEELLREQRLGFRLPSELLQIDYLRDQGVLQPLGSPKRRPEEGDLHAQVRVNLHQEFLNKVTDLARDRQVLERHLLMARLLGGLVVLLLTVAGYLRLEAATRGYYTRLLRVGAGLIVVLTGVGLWMTL